MLYVNIDMPNMMRLGLREARTARGLTQAGLAEAVGVSRQSLVAIESGRSEPSVGLALRLARMLEGSVEALFGASHETSQIEVFPARPPSPVTRGAKRHAVGFVRDRWVAHPLRDEMPETAMQSADAVSSRLTARRRRGPIEVELLRTPEELRDNVLLTGCAPALGLLAARLNRTMGPGRFVWLPQSSRAALRSLADGETHVSGIHMGPASSADANIDAVRDVLPGHAVWLITLTAWETVLAFRATDTPIRSVSDLARSRVRIATREPGSGARSVLERHLASAGIAPRKRLRDAPLATGHLEVARLVATGVADTGVTLSSTARAHGLECIPLETERFDLVIPAEAMQDPRITRMLDTLTHVGFRTEITSLGGHDVRQAGTRVAQL